MPRQAPEIVWNVMPYPLPLPLRLPLPPPLPLTRFVLKGTANVAPGGMVELWMNSSGARDGGQSVFQAC